MIFIDYQPTQIYATSSMDLQLLVDNVVRVAKLGKIFNLPIILSTVNVKGGQKPTIPALKQVLSDQEELDRTTINAWEDREFLQAVEATGRKKLIMCALWTEACLIFPSLDALRDGYEVYPVVDAVGGTSVEAHQYALQRIAQAGGKLESWAQLMCEVLRDWGRSDTVQAVRQIAFDPSSPIAKNVSRQLNIKGVSAP
ncbi:MAG TPA: hydrolase [Candidatus Angelobacter sp.]|nr:hydrolase [Candidatus Angelobacter sp.]